MTVQTTWLSDFGCGSGDGHHVQHRTGRNRRAASAPEAVHERPRASPVQAKPGQARRQGTAVASRIPAVSPPPGVPDAFSPALEIASQRPGCTSPFCSSSPRAAPATAPRHRKDGRYSEQSTTSHRPAVVRASRLHLQEERQVEAERREGVRRSPPASMADVRRRTSVAPMPDDRTPKTPDCSLRP
jgi:hypothetical protein